MGKGTIILVFILCLNICITVFSPATVIGDKQNLLGRFFNIDSDGTPVSMSSEFNSTLPNSLAQENVVSGDLLASFTDSITLAWDFVTLIISFVFAPILLLLNLELPGIVVMAIGAPLVLIIFISIFEFVRGNDF